MMMQSAGTPSALLYRSLLNRAKSTLSRWRDAVARDLNISPADLVSLMFTSPESLGSLNKRLAYAGLSEEALVVSHPDELRDLRRICSLCVEKARCARDLRHKRMATPSKYCPNELTLRALGREASNERTA